MVEYGRRPYSTDCRFFKDSDEVVRIKWYPALPDAGVLPFPSKITSLDWSSWPWLAEGVGEVFKPSRGPTLLGDRPFNHAQPIPYAKGIEPCQGAEVFAQGEEFDPDAPPQQYDELGFPLCCLNHITASGGIEWNGAAVINTNDSCGTAFTLDYDTDYEFSIPPLTELFYRWPSPEFTLICFRWGFPTPAPADVLWSLYFMAACPLSGFLYGGVGDVDHQQQTNHLGGGFRYFYLRVQNTHPTDTFTFKVRGNSVACV